MGKVWQINIHWKYLKKNKRLLSIIQLEKQLQQHKPINWQPCKTQNTKNIRTILKDKQLLCATFVNQYKFYITQNVYQ